MLNRVFFFADGEYTGRLGGGGRGIIYRLYEAASRYGLLDDSYYIFSDTCLFSRSDESLSFEKKEAGEDGIKGLMDFYLFLDQSLKFTSDDVYIFHDLTCFYAMKNTISWIDRTAVVYHGQGSLYHEAEIYGLNPDQKYREKCDQLTKYVLSYAQRICFPSEGARAAFIETSSDEIRQLMEICEGSILYNGCSPKLSPEVGEIELYREIRSKHKGGRIFVSVATLNEAKGVHRLPAFFREYGKRRDYLWIIVGDGAMADRLKDEMEDIREHVVWIRNSLSNDQILRLYDMADYYIMAHNISIFDFATIEALHMGVVPVLTSVGGNLEMVSWENGYLLDGDLGNLAGFWTWEEGSDLEELKKKNIEIAQQYFSERSMVASYVELIEELSGYGKNKDILFLVPDLELNGAQVVLSELLKLSYFKEKSIELIAPSKGVFGACYRKMGIDVLIRPFMAGDEAFRRHIQEDYGSVFINTSSCVMYIMYFQNTKVPVYFWLHETFAQMKAEETGFLDPRLYSPNINIMVVTEAVREGLIKKYSAVRTRFLPMPVNDRNDGSDIEFDRIAPEILEKVAGKILFFLPAAYTPIKGQTVLVDAILSLPAEYREKAHFLICGYKLPNQGHYYEGLKSICEKIPEVTMLDELDREEVYFWYRVCDCVLAPSIVDATPTSIVEAMMFGKITLISDATGIAHYLRDCQSSFIFPSGDVEEFTKRIMLIIHDYGMLDKIGLEGRRIYEDVFSPDHVNGLVETYLGKFESIARENIQPRKPVSD